MSDVSDLPTVDVPVSLAYDPDTRTWKMGIYTLDHDEMEIMAAALDYAVSVQQSGIDQPVKMEMKTKGDDEP